MQWVRELFSNGGFMPHGFCYTWDPYVIWLNAIADALIALAYYTIPLTLIYFVRRRKDLVFDWMFVCFALFIVACGTTHVMEVVSIWRPMYWLAGTIKGITASLSIITAVALILLVPKALALPSPKQLRSANRALEEAQHALRRTNEELELRIAERTASLAATNAALLAEVEERKRTGEHLRETERQLRTAISKLPIPSMIYDEEGVVRFLSEGWTAYSGYSLEEIRTVGDWTLRAYGEKSELAREHIDKLFTISGTVHEGEWTIRAKSGELRVWDFCSTPLGRNTVGKRLLMSIATDVTDRKRADHQKNQFLALLAHELRNPLAPIRSALHIIGQPKAAPVQVERVRQMAERQVRHMARLLDDLLDMARISQGRMELRPELLEIGGALECAADSVRSFCDERRHELEVVLPARPLWVWADSTRLEQVLTNLLNNAAKYTDPGGWVRISAAAEGAEAVIRVRDSGIGIEPAMLPRIFDLFVQAERRLNRSAGGVGIGLTLVKKLVEMHGGRVEAFSPGPGKGSEFVIRLPAYPSEGINGEAGSKADPAPAEVERLRILVVDDNVDAADALALALQLDGHEVQTAYDGPGALVAAQGFRPQLIVLDLGLPGMNGYDVARRLRENPETRDVWLAAVTGCSRDADGGCSEAAGFSCHLVKPVDLPALRRVIANARVSARVRLCHAPRRHATVTVGKKERLAP